MTFLRDVPGLHRQEEWSGKLIGIRIDPAMRITCPSRADYPNILRPRNIYEYKLYDWIIYMTG